MTKQEKIANQKQVNDEVLTVFYDMQHTLYSHGTPSYWDKLDFCNAKVARIDGMFILKSYDTIVAAICDDGVCYDFLRAVYGYTATSAQHITKFMKKYGQGNGKKTYYPIAE